MFDLDDTLCDYAAARLVRLRRAFAGPDPLAPLVADEALERMIAASLAIHPHGSDHFADLFAAHGVGDARSAAEAAEWYRANRFHGLALFPDAAKVVATVRSLFPGQPVSIGVVTNGPADVQRAKIRLLGIDWLADFALVSGEFGAWKPDRAIFGEALRLGGVMASEAIVVGDSLDHDIAGAAAAGIRSVWINRARRPRLDGEPAPDHEVAGIAEVPDLLASLAGEPRSTDPDRP